MEIMSRSRSSSFKFGLSHISDVVSGALNKIKSTGNRTPTSVPQSDSLGRYCGQMSGCSMMNPQELSAVHSECFLSSDVLPIMLPEQPFLLNQSTRCLIFLDSLLFSFPYCAFSHGLSSTIER